MFSSIETNLEGNSREIEWCFSQDQNFWYFGHEIKSGVFHEIEKLIIVIQVQMTESLYKTLNF
jgi:hypothetical protein